ncbi:MAG TPA: hypothetical protein VGN53_05770 [Klebsiella sp.]|jgi:hypothetical protein
MNTETVNELIQSLESGELSIKETKYLELAREFKQLAAENVAMIRLLTDISENHVEYYSEGEDGMFAGVPLDYVSEINMYVSRDVNAENPFPATDRIVAEAEARGLEKAKEIVLQCHDNICPGGLAENRQYEEAMVQPYLDSISDELDFEIEQLREGAN